MPNTEIKPGDVVRLKSGGPPMTVNAALDGGAFWCQWFDGTKALAEAFPGHSLEIHSNR